MKNVLLLLLALIACNKTNPNYCSDHPDHNCNEAIDARDHDAPNGSCASVPCVTGVCDTTSNTCVQCTAAMPQACTTATPVCGSDDMCRPCAGDSECTASGACMVDGSCALASAVLYASPTGGANSTCAIGDKCTLDHALTLVDTTHTIIHLDPGTYGTAGITPTQDMTIVGRGATIDKNMGGNGPVFTIAAGRSITLDLMTITGGDDPTLGSGITCTSATLAIHAATISTNAGMGINSADCNVVLARSTVYNNTKGGVYLNGITTTMTFDVTDNFIIHNGNGTDALLGGLTIGPTIVSTSRLEFNTIADNTTSTGSAHAGGVACDITNFHANNNIVARNLKVSSPSQTFGVCDYPTSKVQDDVVGLDFARVDSGPPYSYEIGTNSTAKDMATTASTVDIDVDGDHRPQGAQKDIGADEYKP
jgi:hypothetical protein